MTCKPMRKLSLFSGIGGLDLAAKLAGMETVAFCEREAFPCKVLMHRFPGIPIYDDVRTLTAKRLKEDGLIDEYRNIDILSAGYPCQPFSAAGKRKGENDDRHLWPEVARLLYEIRPTWFVGENVAGHVSLGLDTVLSDLEAIGYQAEVFIIPSCAVGAPHRRDRVFIVGYTDIPAEWSLDAGKQPALPADTSSSGDKRDLEQLFIEQFGDQLGWSRVVDDYYESNENVGNAAEPRLSERGSDGFDSAAAQTEAGMEQQLERSSQDVANTTGFSSDCSQECDADTEWETAQSGWSNPGARFADQRREPKTEVRTAAEGGFASTEPRLGRVLDGFSAWLDEHPWPAGMGAQQQEWEPPRTTLNAPDRVARLKALGNAVNPMQAFPIFYVIRNIHDYMHMKQLQASKNRLVMPEEVAG